jgi:CubicO group peptidase (beta-lactamase class C family)
LIEVALRASVDAGDLAGAATLVSRDGRVLHTAAVGRRDLATNAPVERDTIFRIASMTKPVTTVAALMLYDEGRFALDEPITRHAPELARLRILRDANGPLDQTDEAKRPITFGDLLTHRSGLTYGEFHRGPISRACAKTLGGTIDNALAPDEWIARLATLPLIDQPGVGFHYGLSTDLLGFLVARLEGVPLGVVLQRRVFAPLGMHDTGFVAPREKRMRRAGFCGFDAEGKLTALTSTPGGHALAERPDDMIFESGGQGLWSTVDDYLAFARLFLGRGEVDGVRLLRPETCATMASNQLTSDQRRTARMFGRPVFEAATGTAWASPW